MTGYSLFASDTVFFANLFTVPFIAIWIATKCNAKHLYYILAPVALGSTYFLITQNKIKSLYLIFESLSLLIMCMLPKYFNKNVNINSLSFFKFTSFLYLISYFSMSPINYYWSEGRYAGPLLNTNLSIYFLIFSLLFISVSYKADTKIGFSASALSILLIMLCYALSQSRSVIFFLPVFIFLLAKYKFFKYSNVMIFSLSLFTAGFIMNSQSTQEGRFDSEEVSYLTRVSITDALLEKTVETNGIPQGPRYSTDFVVNLTGNSDMHPHNDMIAGYIDYGILFPIAILIFIYNLYKLNKNAIFLTLCIGAYFSSSLHGYLFGCLLLPSLLSVLKQYSLVNSDI